MLKFQELDSKALIEQARKRALNFSWKKTANDLIQLYEVKVVA
jgi:glycosyltransferase involved in cell wall biosynthesis